MTGDPAGDNTHLISPWLSDRAALLRRLQASVAFARQLGGVDSSAIAAIGYCFGGLCVLDLARGDTGAVAGVVSLHGMVDGNGLDATGPIGTTRPLLIQRSSSASSRVFAEPLYRTRLVP